jgi:hypothetical protein
VEGLFESLLISIAACTSYESSFSLLFSLYATVFTFSPPPLPPPSFSATPPSFSTQLFFLHAFFTLKQHNTTPMLSDGLCGFRVKNAQRKKAVAEKRGGWVAKKEGAKKSEKR